MGVTALIPFVILLGALVCPALLPFPFWAPLACHPVMLVLAWGVTMWLGRLRFGPPPPDRLTDARSALFLLSLVLVLLSRDPETARLGFWTAAVALMTAAWADGSLLAVVSLRRNIGLPRTLAVVVRHARTAEREAWSEVTGRTQ